MASNQPAEPEPATTPAATPAATPATTVLLVRHGRTPTTGKVMPGRASGLSLDEVGVSQAASVAEQVTTSGEVAAVYCSPLERTVQTAAPIVAAAGVDLRTDERLLDCDAGDWTGRELEELYGLVEWEVVQRFPSMFRFPGGESIAGMQTRVVGAVLDFVEEHRGSRIVVVTHADPIKAVLAHALGTHLDNFDRIAVAPCSVSAVSYSSTRPTVLFANWSADRLARPAGV